MNDEEIKKLRDKHSRDKKGYCIYCYQRAVIGPDPGLQHTPYPCDALKILREYELLRKFK